RDRDPHPAVQRRLPGRPEERDRLPVPRVGEPAHDPGRLRLGRRERGAAPAGDPDGPRGRRRRRLRGPRLPRGPLRRGRAVRHRGEGRRAGDRAGRARGEDARPYRLTGRTSVRTFPDSPDTPTENTDLWLHRRRSVFSRSARARRRARRWALDEYTGIWPGRRRTGNSSYRARRVRPWAAARRGREARERVEEARAAAFSPSG